MGTSAATDSKASVLSKLAVTEALQDAPGASGRTVKSDALNQGQQQLTPTSTVPARRCSFSISRITPIPPAAQPAADNADITRA